MIYNVSNVGGVYGAQPPEDKLKTMVLDKLQSIVNKASNMKGEIDAGDQDAYYAYVEYQEFVGEELADLKHACLEQFPMDPRSGQVERIIEHLVYRDHVVSDLSPDKVWPDSEEKPDYTSFYFAFSQLEQGFKDISDLFPG